MPKEPERSLSEGVVHNFDRALQGTAIPTSAPPHVEPPFDPTPPATEFPKHTPRHTPQQRQRPHYWGHRQRVRDRFAAGGAESMPDYEIIELLLFSAIPKIDVKPLAKQLLEDFGGIERLLTARREELARHPKVNDWIVHHFKLAEAVAIRLAKTKIADKPLLSSTKAVREYLRTRMAHSPVELLVAVFLDHHHRLITDEELGRGTVNHAPAYPREIAKRALELNASGIVLVHNHPSGDPKPSRDDIVVTQRIKSALETVGVALYDHVIVGKGSEVSLAQLNALD